MPKEAATVRNRGSNDERNLLVPDYDHAQLLKMLDSKQSSNRWISAERGFMN